VGIFPSPHLPSVHPFEHVLGLVSVPLLHMTAPVLIIDATVVGPIFLGLESSHLTLLHMVSHTSPSFLLCCPHSYEGMPTPFPISLFSPPGTWHNHWPLPGLPEHK
jgi:hypothetical protein